MATTGYRLLAGLGLAGGMAAGAAAQPPAPPHGRAAVLLAPRPMEPGPVVRAAPAEARPAAGPGWLMDGPPGGVVQTGATNWGRAATDAPAMTRPATAAPVQQRPITAPQANQQPEPSMVARGMAKLKGLTGGDRPAQPQQPMTDPRTAPGPSSPVAATASNGGQVLAGPPAMRWYGYGSVTPGANAFAPAGQYPRASANWYAVTGATPGAFPVPVMGPGRPLPGGEPPAYAHASAPPGYRGPGIAGPVMVGPTNVMPQTPPRTMTPPSAPAPVRTAGVPTLAAPPGLGAELPTTPAKPAVPLAVVPAAKSPEPEPAALPTTPATPAPLPVMPPTPVSAPAPAPTTPPAPPADDVRWQPGPAKPTVAPTGERWGPSSPGATDTARQPVARGQMPEADAAADLIRAVCHGRADGVEVRRTGANAYTVAFAVRSAAAAQGLVNDISRRPELGPLRIDFAARLK